MNRNINDEMTDVLVLLCTEEGIDGLLWSYLVFGKAQNAMQSKGYERTPHYRAFRFIYDLGENVDDVLTGINSQITEHIMRLVNGE